jgi:hypothetical protein
MRIWVAHAARRLARRLGPAEPNRRGGSGRAGPAPAQAKFRNENHGDGDRLRFVGAPRPERWVQHRSPVRSMVDTGGQADMRARLEP